MLWTSPILLIACLALAVLSPAVSGAGGGRVAPAPRTLIITESDQPMPLGAQLRKELRNRFGFKDISFQLSGRDLRTDVGLRDEFNHANDDKPFLVINEPWNRENLALAMPIQTRDPQEQHLAFLGLSKGAEQDSINVVKFGFYKAANAANFEDVLRTTDTSGLGFFQPGKVLYKAQIFDHLRVAHF